MTSAGGGAYCASLGLPTRQTAASAPAERTPASSPDWVRVLRFMRPSLCCVRVGQALAEVFGELGALLGSEQRRDDLVEAHRARAAVLGDVRVGRVGGGERLGVELVGHEGGLERLDVRV